MSHNYGLRLRHRELDSDSFEVEDAASTVGATSSPSGVDLPDLDLGSDVPFMELAFPDEDDDEDDLLFNLTGTRRAPKKSDVEKTLEILGFMKSNFKQFSLRLFLQTLFTSDNGSIKNYTNIYLQNGGAVHLMEIGMGDRWKGDEALCDSIVQKAADICSREASWLTDQASRGPNFSDAQFLRVKATDVKVEMLHSFRLRALLDRYERTLPRFQQLLKAVIGKTEPVHQGSRNPDMVCTEICSCFYRRSHTYSRVGLWSHL